MEHQRCSDEAMARVVELLRRQDAQALPAVESLLQTFPNDPRLSFLRGSLLATAERYPEALREFKESVENDPTYDIARFQWGLLLATLKRLDEALVVWAPLKSRERDDGLAMFAHGIERLINGDLAACRRCLRAGIALNTWAPSLSVDMERVVERIEQQPQGPSASGSVPTGHLLISEYLLGHYTRH